MLCVWQKISEMASAHQSKDMTVEERGAALREAAQRHEALKAKHTALKAENKQLRDNIAELTEEVRSLKEVILKRNDALRKQVHCSD